MPSPGSRVRFDPETRNGLPAASRSPSDRLKRKSGPTPASLVRTYGSRSHLRSRGRGMWIAVESVTRCKAVHKMAVARNENARTWRAFSRPEKTSYPMARVTSAFRDSSRRRARKPSTRFPPRTTGVGAGIALDSRRPELGRWWIALPLNRNRRSSRLSFRFWTIDRPLSSESPRPDHGTGPPWCRSALQPIELVRREPCGGPRAALSRP
jgi:hypothetical protein